MLYKWDIPKRYIKLQLISGKGGEILSDLDIDARITFNTAESVGGGASEANIIVHGLTMDKMAFIASTSTQWIKNAVQNKVTIDAGYVGKHAIIFSGIINDATPSLNNANYSIHLKALSGFDLQLSANRSYTFSGDVPASVIANTFARDLNFLFINALTDDKIISNYHTDAMSILDNMRYLSRLCNCDVYCSYNRLIIKNTGSGYVSCINDELIIDEKNLIGNPEITHIGVDVKIKMDPAVMGGMRAKVISKNFKMLEKLKFNVQSFNHAGDTMGNDWQTRIKLVRDDLLKD